VNQYNLKSLKSENFMQSDVPIIFTDFASIPGWGHGVAKSLSSIGTKFVSSFMWTQAAQSVTRKHLDPTSRLPTAV
jgi:hypothetical protein